MPPSLHYIHNCILSLLHFGYFQLASRIVLNYSGHFGQILSLLCLLLQPPNALYHLGRLDAFLDYSSIFETPPEVLSDFDFAQHFLVGKENNPAFKPFLQRTYHFVQTLDSAYVLLLDERKCVQFKKYDSFSKQHSLVLDEVGEVFFHQSSLYLFQ